MKKNILVVLFVFTAVFANAQEKDQFTKDTEQLVEIVSKSAFEPVVAQFTAMVAEDKKEALKKDVEATFSELFASIAKIYKEEFTHSEVKDILAFYATPTGKKLAEKTGVLTQKGMAAGQAWGMKLQKILGKYME